MYLSENDSYLYQRTVLLLCLDSCGKDKISRHCCSGSIKLSFQLMSDSVVESSRSVSTSNNLFACSAD